MLERNKVIMIEIIDSCIDEQLNKLVKREPKEANLIGGVLTVLSSEIKNKIKKLK